MAEHDLEVAFNKALDVTGAPNLYYVGHSQGTEIMFARLAAGDTGFNQKVLADS
jgi:predicted alpha/beta hydrolase